MMEEKIKKLIDDLRIYLNIDGGDIEFIKYEDNILYVKLIGNCANCMLQDQTLNENLLQAIKEEVPEIKEIINVEL
ncbi:MAG: NifU family protein [Bacilli bacterium]|nr:NifU family protein [Bacilli bacterium]